MKRKDHTEEVSDFQDSGMDEDPISPPPAKKQIRINNDDMAMLSGSEEAREIKIFKAQIEMNKETMPAKRREKTVAFIQELTTALMTLPAMNPVKMVDQEWVKEAKLQVPFNQVPYEVKGNFHFQPPSSVTTIGSFVTGTSIKGNQHVDLALKMPSESMEEKDYLNQRYLRKRALYLVAIAKGLQQCPLVAEMSFTYHHGNQLKPLLVIKPTGKLGKSVSVRLHPYMEHQHFKLSRFHPARNNIRCSWYDQEREDDDIATPYHNSAIQRDMCLMTSHETVAKVLSRAEGLTRGLALLKQWLSRRQLNQGHGCFSNFIMSNFLIYLLRQQKITKKMDAFMIFREAINQLASSDWLTNPPNLFNTQNTPAPNQPTIEDYQQHFEVVFVDSTGWLNICSDMTADCYRMVRYEADLSTAILKNLQLDSYNKLLNTDVKFFSKYDQSLRIERLQKLTECIEKLGCKNELMDRGGDHVATLLPHLMRLIHRAADTRRIVAMHARPQPASIKQWSVSEAAPEQAKETLTIGFVCNPDTVNQGIIRGPKGGTPEAVEFQKFWGDRAELRKFGSEVAEVVAWKYNNMYERRAILNCAIRYILHRHAALPRNSLQSTVAQLDPLLKLHASVTPGKEEEAPGGSSIKDYGTGEERNREVAAAFSALKQQLTGIRLQEVKIDEVHGISPAFRLTEVFPTIKQKGPWTWQQPYEVLCKLERRSEWPDDKEAVQQLKTLFIIEVCKELKKKNYTADMYEAHDKNKGYYVEVSKASCIFRLEVVYDQEIELHRTVRAPDGRLQRMDTDAALALHKHIVSKPQITNKLHGMATMDKYSSYGTTARLAKRWLRSHMLCDYYLPEEAVDLMVASLYISPAPYAAPTSPLAGFVRFLRLLANFNWTKMPLIVNLHECSDEEVAKVEAEYTENPNKLPAIVTVEASSMCTQKHAQWLRDNGHNTVIFNYATSLARVALPQLEEKLDHTVPVVDFKKLFRPPLEKFDNVLAIEPALQPRSPEAVDEVTFTEEDVARIAVQTKLHNGFNTVQDYVQKLRDCYGQFALFFHDPMGGKHVAVLWRPDIIDTLDYKEENFFGRVLDLTSGKPMLKFSKEALLSEFNVIMP